MSWRQRVSALWRGTWATPAGACRTSKLSTPDASGPSRRGPYAEWHGRQDEALRAAPPYPERRFRRAGIVIVAGGPRYYTCAWVCLTLQRRVLGCNLPIQVWYLGPDEMSMEMIKLLRPFEVEYVDALEVRRRHPVRRLHGWECKPYAMLHSPFQEAILLDADNVPLVDPAFLLASPEYRRTGAIFWPDVGRLGPERAIWEICRVAYRDEPEFESGQIVIDKARCWAALQLTMHLNEWSDFYCQHVLGDKETFHMAWRRLDQPFSMPTYPPGQLVGRTNQDDRHASPVLLQHDFDGRVIFQHRTAGAKWVLWGENMRFPDFRYERECFDALAELRRRWSGWVRPPAGAAAPLAASEADVSRTRYFLYCRVGSDQRVLELLPDCHIGRGGGLCEQTWYIDPEQAQPILVIVGDHEETCRLSLGPDGIWRGRWLHHERMPIELVPLGPEAGGESVGTS